MKLQRWFEVRYRSSHLWNIPSLLAWQPAWHKPVQDLPWPRTDMAPKEALVFAFAGIASIALSLLWKRRKGDREVAHGSLSGESIEELAKESLLNMATC